MIPSAVNSSRPLGPKRRETKSFTAREAVLRCQRENVVVNAYSPGNGPAMASALACTISLDCETPRSACFETTRRMVSTPSLERTTFGIT